MTNVETIKEWVKEKDEKMKLEIDFKNLSETEKEKLLALVEKASNKPAPYFIPQRREEYWFVAENGEVRHYTYHDFLEDIHAFETGNCFCTEEEAREALMRMKMQTKWKHLSLEAGEANNPWDGEHGHYYVWYSDFCNEIETNYTYGVRYGIVTFPSDGSLKAAIAELGEENVKRYILEVTK